MEISDFESAATFLNRIYTIQKFGCLSNEMFSICVAQGAAKLQEVKVEGPKILLYACEERHFY